MIQEINIKVCKKCGTDIYPEDTSCAKCGLQVPVYVVFGNKVYDIARTTFNTSMTEEQFRLAELAFKNSVEVIHKGKLMDD